MSGFTTTPNLGLLKPTVGGDDDAWGGHINQNADTLDASVATKTYVDGRRRRTLNVVTASVPNSGASTAEEVAAVWTLAAALLANVGDIIHVVVKVELAGTTDSKTAKIRLGTASSGLVNAIIATSNYNAASTTHAILECWIMKTGANTQRTWYWGVNATNAVVSGDASLALTDTAPLYLSVTIQNATAAAAGSITIFSAIAEFLPAG